jgi:hypothetical protein
MWEDGETMVLKTTFEEREELMAADPETYFITDHYLNYEYVLVNLSKVSEEALEDLLRGAHRLAQVKKINNLPQRHKNIYSFIISLNFG